MYPFKQSQKGDTIIREFAPDVDSEELVWHRDRSDRYVKVLEGSGWYLQVDNQIPQKLVEGSVYFIPANNYHRVIRGKDSLVVSIKENKMKVTRRQLRRVIKEALDALTGDEYSSSMDKLSGLHGELAADIDELKDYEKIDYILSILVEDELSEIGVPMNKVKDVLMKYPEPRTLYNKVYDDLNAVVNNMAHRPDGYRWDEVFTRMIVEALGIKLAWTKRLTAAEHVKRRVNSLMRSKLFVNANPKDKQAATAKITKALLGLQQYGGYETFYEEILDDALGTRSELKNRLAAAADMNVYDWGDKLAVTVLRLIRRG